MGQRLKIIVLGQSGVGKTSLVEMYAEQNIPDGHHSSIGVDLKIAGYHRSDPGNQVKFCIWDTAGQERFRSLVRHYYKDSDGVVLMYDVTDRASFSDLEFWLREVQEHCAKSPAVIVVGNKRDLTEHREVSVETARQFAELHGLPLLEISSTSLQEVQQVFENLYGRMVPDKPERSNDTVKLSSSVKKKLKCACG